MFKIKPDILRGSVVDSKTGKPLDKALVYLLDKKMNKVWAKDLTDGLGSFLLKIPKESGYRLAVVKDGFEPSPMMDFTKEGILANDIEIGLVNIVSTAEMVELEINKFGGILRRVLVSSWLTISLGLELIFWKNMGFDITWPWVVISWLNMGLWLYMRLKPNEEVS
jgi:hypothetical protein